MSENVILTFGKFQLNQKVKRLAIMLNAEQDQNVVYLLRRVFQFLPLFTVAKIFETAMANVICGAAVKADGTGLPRTPLGEFLFQIRCGPLTEAADVKAIRMRPPPWKMSTTNGGKNCKCKGKKMGEGAGNFVKIDASNV